MTVPVLESRASCADRIDGIGWTHGVSRLIQGRAIGLRSDSPALLREMEALAGPYGDAADRERVQGLFSMKAGGPGKRRGLRNFFVLYDGWTKVARSLEKEPVLREFRARWLSAVATTLYPETNLTLEGIVLGHQGLAHAWLGLSVSQAAELMARAQSEGMEALSKTALVLNLAGTIRPMPDSATQEGAPADLGSLPDIRLSSLTFVEPVAAPQTLTPGQGALKLLNRGIGNSTLRGELVALSSAVANAVCRAIPASAIPQSPLRPEPALTP